MIKSQRVRQAGHVARIEEKRNSCMLLMGKLEGKCPPGKPTCRWVDIINLDL
jgi:hypothetical protein